MTQAKARRAVAEIAGELSAFALEPYVVGPTGVGVLRLAVAEHVSAYVSFAYFAKYQALGTYAGFSVPELKAITDECLREAGRQLGVVPHFALAKSCPAVLYPLEFFVPSPIAQPFKLDGAAAQWARRAIGGDLLGSWAWLRGRSELLQFLAADTPPFSWAVADVPRRLVQVAYLAQVLGVPIETARKLVAPAVFALRGDADFDGCDGRELAEAVVAHFYRLAE